MRFEGAIPREYLRQLLLVLPYVVILRIGVFTVLGVYRLVWRYISLRDVPRVLGAIAAGSAAIVAARYTVAPLFRALGVLVNPMFATVPFGVLAGEALLTGFGVVTARALWRVIQERAKLRQASVGRPVIVKRRALLLGAGSAGVMVARELGGPQRIHSAGGDGREAVPSYRRAPTWASRWWASSTTTRASTDR